MVRVCASTPEVLAGRGVAVSETALGTGECCPGTLLFSLPFGVARAPRHCVCRGHARPAADSDPFMDTHPSFAHARVPQKAPPLPRKRRSWTKCG